jgi:hypothetical protein
MAKLRARVATAMAASAILGIGIITAAAAPASAQTVCGDLSGTQVLISHGGDLLDNYGGGSGAAVHTYPFTGSDNQTWCAQQALGSGQYGYYFLQLNSSGALSGNCLNAPAEVSGQPIDVYSCNGTLAQRWCWNGSGYMVTAGNFDYALRDNGTYNVVTINEGGGNNTWSIYDGALPGGDNC